MKKINIVIACLLCISFIMAGCAKKNDPDPDPPDPTSSLNGYWDRGDIVVHINGSQGTFYQINSGRWKNALEQGFITIGSLKNRYLIKLKGGTWSGQTLWVKWSGSTIEEVKWSETGEFELSNDGKTLYITTNDPWTGGSQTGEYERINP